MDEGDDDKSKTTRGGKKSTRARGRGKASIASQRSGATSRRGRGKKIEEESMPILPSQEDIIQEAPVIAEASQELPAVVEQAANSSRTDSEQDDP